MSNLAPAIRQHAEEHGVPSRMVCPHCLGGSEHEECMTVFQAEDYSAVLATCHRAQCPIETISAVSTGRIPSNATRKAAEQDEMYKVVLERAIAVPDDLIIPAGYSYSDEAKRRYMLYDEEGARLVFPLLDSTREIQGVVGKLLYGSGPKSVYLAPAAYSGLSWYVTRPTSEHQVWSEVQDEVVVVEDCLSAVALVDQGKDAISLNGTNLNTDRAALIMQQYDTIILALDADATRIAIKHANKLRGVTNIVVRRLDHDIKDMPNHEVAAFVSSL